MGNNFVILAKNYSVLQLSKASPGKQKLWQQDLSTVFQNETVMKEKNSTFLKIAEMLQQQGFTIHNKDDSRPWGGYYVIEESDASRFIDQFFPGESIDQLKITEKLSPKVLLVAPQTRLSWQYHHRRAEIWKCLEGPVSVATSDDDQESKKHVLQKGETIRLRQGERHRLIGLEHWGIIAEIWQHTDSENPSNEDDIVRVQDDFGR